MTAPDEAPDAAPAAEAESSAAPDPPAAPAPDADPFRLRCDPPRVMRLSRRTLALLGLVAGLAIGAALLFALRPVPKRTRTNLYAPDSGTASDLVTAAPGDYASIPKLGPPLPGDLGRPIVAARARHGTFARPRVDAGHPVSRNTSAGVAEEQRQRVAQERASARTSKLFAPAGSRTAATASVPERSVPALESAASGTGTSDRSAARSGPQAFLARRADRAVTSSEGPASLPSRYILQAGSVIPAALITAIRSDLPGTITAQVTGNVYDSPTGRILLIPQGARLIGSYDSQLAQGQTRVLLAWDRLILPDGRSLLLDRQPGTDAAGMAGLHDRTNMHWGNMLEAALISSLVGVGTGLANDNESALAQALRYGVQDTANQSGRQLIERQLAIKPTLTIRPGFALRILVTRDLIFR